MQKPGRVDFAPEQIEALLDRIANKCLEADDYPLLTDLIMAMVWLNVSLQERTLSIQRLRAIFGIKTETANRLLGLARGKGKNKDKENQSSADDDGAKGSNQNKGKHGHRPLSAYTQAKTIEIAHQALKKGSLCPACLKGKLFNLSPGNVLHIKGQPWLQVEIYRPERLRCPLCGKIFTADLPHEVATGSRADCTAKAIVSLLKYRGGVPFNRQGQIQEALGAPIFVSEIWEMTEDVADALQPIYSIVCEEASNADLFHNDDTKARVMSIAQERKQREDTGEEDARKGTFTTCIIAERRNPASKIALFFTGRKHAGENLNELLSERTEEMIPIQHCDGGNNIPKDHQTQISNCLSHARRYFYELASMWPKVVAKVISWFASIFYHDKLAPSDPKKRLKWHQEKSKPIMEQMRQYFKGLIENKEVEPNSSLGKAIAYFNNHWEGLTLFFRVPGVPLTNNACERLIKIPVRNRKNAYFYLNETGAKIGDILMSMIETCILNCANPYDYLVAVQQYMEDVRRNPHDWMPWHFQDRLKELRPP